MGGSSEPEARYPTAWSWVLLLAILNSFRNDYGSQSSKDLDYVKAILALEKIGFIPAVDLKEVVLRSARMSFKISIPNILSTAFEEGPGPDQELAFLHLVDNLRLLAASFRSSSKHILVIDGLDDILTSKEVQYQSLAALAVEVSRLNMLFHDHGTPAKIILLCRTELYEKLPGPNKNKLRQDSALELDWYHDPREPSNSNLVQLINLRTSLTYPGIKDTFKYYFYDQTDGKNIREYLLDMTRHTPRDFVQVMNYIQRYYTGERFVRDQIMSGLREYSIKYFMPEIKDELAGYIVPDDIEISLRAIASLGKRDFKTDEVIDKLK